jgi:hypothetical protein
LCGGLKQILKMATKLDLADAQFIGFKAGKWESHDITGMVEAMGLTKKEWLKWKCDYPTILDNEDVKAIDEYFNERGEK